MTKVEPCPGGILLSNEVIMTEQTLSQWEDVQARLPDLMNALKTANHVAGIAKTGCRQRSVIIRAYTSSTNMTSLFTWAVPNGCKSASCSIVDLN